MAYHQLPLVAKAAATDRSGRNPGNWTLTFDTGDLAQKLYLIEVYRFIVETGPVGSLFTSSVDNFTWHGKAQGSSNGWSEPPALPLRDGQTLFMFWNVPVSSLPVPQVLIWTRFDDTIPGNAYSLPGRPRAV